MSVLLSVSRLVDAVNGRLGRWCAWLILAAVLVSAINAITRKLFDLSSNSWLELQWVLFGVVFLVCSPWTLLSNEHIRIDIVSSYLPKRVRDGIDVFGHLAFLLPFTIVMIVTAFPFAARSYQINEQSMNAGGLPQWPSKFLVLIGFLLLFFQGISELIKRLAVMRGDIEDPHAQAGPHAAHEIERHLGDGDPEHV